MGILFQNLDADFCRRMATVVGSKLLCKTNARIQVRYFLITQPVWTLITVSIADAMDKPTLQLLYAPRFFPTRFFTRVFPNLISSLTDEVMPVNTLLLLIVIALSIYLCVAMVAPEKFQE